MKYLKIIPISILILALGCSDSLSPDEEGIVYSNGFEKESDFNNWEGINTNNWNDDVPNNTSNKSIFISGGCLVPHAWYIFQNDLPAGFYTIECWGKAMPKTFGGGVALKYYTDENYNYSEVNISFGDSVWTHKISDTLYYDRLAELRIEMMAGGYIASAMLIDNMVVKRIE